MFCFCPTQEGNTPLHYAALSDSPDVITFLLGKANGGSGISYGSGRCTSRRRSNGLLDLRNDAWETPLLRSAVGGSVPVAKALLVRTRRCAVVITIIAENGDAACIAGIFGVVF